MGHRQEDNDLALVSKAIHDAHTGALPPIGKQLAVRVFQAHYASCRTGDFYKLADLERQALRHFPKRCPVCGVSVVDEFHDYLT